MSYRKPKLPWNKDEYVIIKEHNECWLRGSFSRAMASKHFQEKYGYKFLMASEEFLEKLRKDPSLRETTWYAEEQRKLEENSIVNKLEEK